MSIANYESGHARPSFCCRCQRPFDDCHADGDSVTDLFEDGRLRSIGDAGRQFQPTNDGAGMHDDGSRSLRCEALARELVGFLVLREVELRAGEPFRLDAEHHDHL